MTRISKDPDERRSELIEAAERLFSDKGYEDTAVSDIVKSIGVAQGTFYYYFKSKRDVLDAVVEHYIAVIIAEIDKIVDSNTLDAMSKIKAITDEALVLTETREKLIVYIHRNGNQEIHDKLSKAIIKHFIPGVTKLVKQGISEGIFNTDYAEETAEFIMAGAHWIGELDEYLDGKESYLKKLMATEYIVKKLLGISDRAMNEIKSYIADKEFFISELF